jgi:hypothetical protein
MPAAILFLPFSAIRAASAALSLPQSARRRLLPFASQSGQRVSAESCAVEQSGGRLSLYFGASPVSLAGRLGAVDHSVQMP